MTDQDRHNMEESKPNEQQERQNRKTIIVDSGGPIELNKRIAIIPQKVPNRFAKKRKKLKLIPTFPSLIVRELICFQLVVIAVLLISLFFDAPLEHLANPNNTPNPAKAPWYFLGLQELLHYFPPVVAGVLIPALVILALTVLPYFAVNGQRTGIWQQNKQKRMLRLFIAVVIIISLCVFYHAYSIAVPTLLMFLLMSYAYITRGNTGWTGWLNRRPLSDWIMTWFVVLIIVLTVIGTWFRGPEWRWVWPW